MIANALFKLLMDIPALSAVSFTATKQMTACFLSPTLQSMISYNFLKHYAFQQVQVRECVS
jgi:hypothetical protein